MLHRLMSMMGWKTGCKRLSATTAATADGSGLRRASVMCKWIDVPGGKEEVIFEFAAQLSEGGRHVSSAWFSYGKFTRL